MKDEASLANADCSLKSMNLEQLMGYKFCSLTVFNT